MKAMGKLVAVSGALAGILVGGLAFARAKSRQGTPAGGGNVGIRGHSGIQWLLSPTGEQMGPAFGTMAWDAYAAPGTGFTSDGGDKVVLPIMTPVLKFLQIGADTATRTFVASYVTGKAWSFLQNAALADLGIKTA